MAWSFNPFTGNLDIVGGGAVVFEGEVETFAELPETVGDPAVGASFLVRSSTGVWLVNRRQAGIWIRRNNTGVRATDWEYGGDYPVNSVNGQTGNVSLTAADVGAATLQDTGWILDGDGNLTPQDAIPTTSPMNATDVEISDPSKGIILQNTNGQRVRVTVNNDLQLVRTVLSLMFFLSCAFGAFAQTRDVVVDTNGVLVAPTNFFTVNIPSRTQTVAMTNSAFRTNTTDNSMSSAQAGMVLNLDANSTYHFAFAFITTSATTGGFGARLLHSDTTNGLRSTYVGRQGRPINVSAIDITASSSGSINLQNVNFAGTNVVVTGTGILATGSGSGTLTLVWHQNTATNVATELVAGSMMTVTKIHP